MHLNQSSYHPQTNTTKPSADFYPTLILSSIHTLNMSSNLRFNEGKNKKHELVHGINPALNSCSKRGNGGSGGWSDISYRQK